jgi:HSP20 family molecular chaperone IbpA
MIIVRRSVRRTPVNVQREMERVFRSWVPLATSIPVVSGRTWRPALEVLESESSFVITAELAGIDELSLEVTVDGEVLTIAGTRPGLRGRHQLRRFFGRNIYPWSVAHRRCRGELRQRHASHPPPESRARSRSAAQDQSDE